MKAARLLLFVLVVAASQVGCALCGPCGCCQTHALAPGIYHGGPVPPPEPCRTCNPVRPRCCHCDGRYQVNRAMYNAVDSMCALFCERPGVGEVDPCCYPRLPNGR